MMLGKRVSNGTDQSEASTKKDRKDVSLPGESLQPAHVESDDDDDEEINITDISDDECPTNAQHNNFTSTAASTSGPSKIGDFSAKNSAFQVPEEDGGVLDLSLKKKPMLVRSYAQPPVPIRTQESPKKKIPDLTANPKLAEKVPQNFVGSGKMVDTRNGFRTWRDQKQPPKKAEAPVDEKSQQDCDSSSAVTTYQRPSVIRQDNFHQNPTLDVDEHFRKSFKNQTKISISNPQSSVEDHFARALGEKWDVLKSKRDIAPTSVT